MFVGYSPVHAGDCYRMFDLVTKKIHTSRDIRWLNRMYYKNKDETEQKKKKSKNSHVDIEDPLDGESPIPSDKPKKVTISPGLVPASSDDDSSKNNDGHVDNSTEEIDYDAHPDDEDKGDWVTATRSGRNMYRPKYGKKAGAAFTTSERNYYAALAECNDYADDEPTINAGAHIEEEIIAVGAGLGGGFEHTTELNVLNYKQAMERDDIEEWKKVIDRELETFNKHKVYKAVKREDLPENTKIVTTTWAMKKNLIEYTEQGVTCVNTSKMMVNTTTAIQLAHLLKKRFYKSYVCVDPNVHLVCLSPRCEWGISTRPLSKWGGDL